MAGRGESQEQLSTLAHRFHAHDGIVILCAAAGFGKTALMHQARMLAERTGTGRILHFSAADHARSPMAAAKALLKAGGRDRLFIDDVRHADGPALADALRLIEAKADRPTVWLALRHPKELAVARLLAQDRTMLIDWRLLRMGDREWKARLDRISPRFRRQVADLARDWPQALAMLERWTRTADPAEADDDPQDLIMESGLDGFIEQDVLPALAPDEHSALIHASITDPIPLYRHGPEDASPDSTRRLLRASQKLAGLIERSGKLLTIQPALRSFLIGQFDDLPPGEQTRTLEITATNYAERNELAVAARLLRRAGLQSRIAQLAVDHGSLRIWIVDGFSVIRALVEQAGEAVVSASPTLQLMKCIVLMKTGRISEAQVLFAEIEGHSGESAETKRDCEVVRVTLLVYGCLLQRNDDLERFRTIVSQSAMEPGWRSLLSTLSCILNAQRARFDAALASLVEARIEARSAGSTYNLMFLALHEANILLAQGALKQARVRLSDARKRWRHEFSQDGGAETVTASLMASLEYESGQLTSARASVRRSAYRMPDSEAWFDIYFAAYEPMVRIIVIDHGLGAALEAIEDQRRKLIVQGLPRVAALLQNLALVLTGECARTHPGDDMPATADVISIEATATWQEMETFNLATAYVRAGQGAGAEAGATLIGLAARAEGGKLFRSALRYRLAAIALAAPSANDAELDDALAEALRLGARSGSPQVFNHHLDARLMSALSRHVANAGSARAPSVTLARALLQRSANRSESGESPLSPREKDVLSALAEGGSDKVLGRLLGLSEHGVRFHLKKIFRKLDVHDRTSAIHRARVLGMI